MKRSIKKQMMFVFMGLMVLLIGLLMFINIYFLEPYYISQKENSFIQIYSQIKAAGAEVFDDEAVISELSMTAERSNASFLVADTADTRLLSTNIQDKEQLMDQLIGYIMNQAQREAKTIRSAKNYQILQSTDPRNKTDYLTMWGQLDEDTIFIVRSPLESMQESAMISNRFLIYIGLILTPLGLLVIWFFSSRLTKPLKVLTKLSDQMAQLDFDAKYSGTEKNEIGELGLNFNRMSGKLESTISELKKANVDLERDIVRKEKEEELRTEFLGNVSHELKTPIALISGYAEGLKEGVTTKPEDQQYYCDVIIDEAAKMNKMVKNLLVLNELELGKDNTEFVRFNLTKMVGQVISSMEILGQQQDVKIGFKSDREYHAWGDELKVEQVLRNYISNALHHVNEEKFVEVKILERQNRLRVSVFNTGQPIPEEDLAHVWDMFYKVDKARTRAYGGNGIGLAIVKATMDSLHQAYGVENYDNGVKFWFELDAK